ncbi:hypothetical protein BWK59_00805 [Flavobacterium davisii]|uniref:DUF3871 family protein n=1 Tax=Flavobacterium davisii TaxID=2906077 RepID=A0A246GLV5_9FLAO|nr:DUF3871 family protein [Flavobacterium davisii]OWP85306.1 hypothetical protein BWK59_00805 [Flavobacterium davisii]
MEMELHTIESKFPVPAGKALLSAGTGKLSPFIEANTETVSLSHLQNECIIPVFTKDNEITISHQEFIQATLVSLQKVFPNEVIDRPEIRISHQIKGRTPDALQIPAKDLQEHQKTIYYERMAFIVRIPSITQLINGNTISLVAGGVRSYNSENLYNTKKLETFQFFIGFQNMVCCNLCVSTDGFKSSIKASSSIELEHRILEVIQSYQMHQQVSVMNNWLNYTLTEKQFAQLIGKSRLYHFLPKKEKCFIPELLLNDSHITTIAKEYYQDENFCRNSNGDINLWNLYNLMTGSNKASYIDTFLERGVNAFSFTNGVSKVLSDGDSDYAWFLS